MEPQHFVSLERRLYQGKNITPDAGFCESLKAFLFTQIGEKNEEWFLETTRQIVGEQEFFSTKERIWARIHADMQLRRPTEQALRAMTFWRRPFFLKILGMSIGAVLLFGLSLRFLLGSGEVRLASSHFIDPTGTVLIEQDGQSHQADAQTVLGAGMTIRTIEDPAALTFFDQSFVFLGAHSALRIEKHLPHPSFPESGEIEINVISGRALIETFADPQSSSQFLVYVGDTVLNTNSAALEIQRNAESDMVLIWGHSAQVTDRIHQQTRLAIADNKILLTSEHAMEVKPISQNDRADVWTTTAFEIGRHYKEQSSENMLQFFKRTVGVLPSSPFYSLKELFEKTIGVSRNAEQYLRWSEQQMREAFLLQQSGQIELAQQTLFRGAQALTNFLQEYPELEPRVEQVFLRLQKLMNMANVNAPIRQIEPLVTATEAEVFADNPVFLHRNLLAILWQIQEIILEENAFVPREKLSEYTAQKELFPNTVTKDADQKRQILTLKIIELRLLDFLFAKIFAETSIRVSEHKIVEEVLALLEEREDVSDLLWNQEDFRSGNDPVAALLQNIVFYDNPETKRTQLEKLLDAVELTARNLPFLQEVRDRIQRDLRTPITDRMVEILETEKQKLLVGEG